MKQSKVSILLDVIQARSGMSLADIAEKVGYPRTYLSDAKKKVAGEGKLMRKLAATFEDILPQELIYTNHTGTVNLKNSEPKKPEPQDNVKELEKRIAHLEGIVESLHKMIVIALQKK